MTNLQRLKLETNGINFTDDELTIYLMENNLTATDDYNIDNKRTIYKTALSILNSLANQPQTMKNYILDDMNVSQFSENLQSRIDQLERQIRQMQVEAKESIYFCLFE
jgi:hypothetical protein